VYYTAELCQSFCVNHHHHHHHYIIIMLLGAQKSFNGFDVNHRWISGLNAYNKVISLIDMIDIQPLDNSIATQQEDL